jgi:succinate-semialdehyde dehydrogenase / glutarate-semialdehyde dehydrogenase
MDACLFIGGEFRSGTSNQLVTVLNPSTAQPIGEFSCASEDDVRAAIDSASGAFRIWRRTSALERCGLLRRVGLVLRDRRASIAQDISRELGKPLDEAEREVETAAEMFEWAAEEARRLYGRTIPARAPGVVQTVGFEPVGPVAAFSGWNAPAITPARKISGALAAGCTIVIKPSEETPSAALAIARAVQDAGVPDGVVNMLFGNPVQLAELLCSAPEIAAVTFTGATAVGAEIGARAARSLKRSTLELGGHAPVIVCADVNVQRVATMAAASKYRNAGQICTSPTRFYVDASIFGEFSEAFLRAARAVRVGDPFEAGTRMGPLKNLRRLQAVERMVQDVRDRGYEVAAGGRRIEGPGYFYEPTVVLRPGHDCDVSHIEPFGPIALLSPVGSLDEAIEEANRLPFGLAAYAFTNRLGESQRLANEIESGAICINEWQVSLPETPFGGRKLSGLGSEGGVEGLHEFLNVKSVRQGQSA